MVLEWYLRWILAVSRVYTIPWWNGRKAGPKTAKVDSKAALHCPKTSTARILLH